MSSIRFKLLLLLWTMAVLSLSGQSIRDVLHEDTPITWLGLDFTGAIFIGDREKLGSENDIRHLIGSFNSLMDTERVKFNINTTLRKKNVQYRLDVAQDHNEKLQLSGIYSDKVSDHLHLSKSDIEVIVKSYDYNGLNGIGLLFNVETFSKTNAEALVWITFVDMDKKELLFTEKMSAQPGGFGLRNFWAGAIYSIMKKIEKKELEMWRKKHS